MTNRFCCKNCGMITDNPTIVPHPEKGAYYGELNAKIDEFLESKEGTSYTPLEEAKVKVMVSRVDKKYNYSITCPVCENETRFWRDKPFPADVKSE